MAVFAVSITKDRPWRGSREEFSNVYHYQTAVGEVFDDESVVQQLVEAERAIFDNAVTFLRARTWGPTDGPAIDSVTRYITDLTGPATGGTSLGAYAELAVMVRNRLPRSPTGRARFLRKWLHTQIPSLSGGSGTMAGTSVIAAAGQTAIEAYFNGLMEVTGATSLSTYQLVTENGVEPLSQSGSECFDWMEHRQF